MSDRLLFRYTTTIPAQVNEKSLFIVNNQSFKGLRIFDTDGRFIDLQSNTSNAIHYDDSGPLEKVKILHTKVYAEGGKWTVKYGHMEFTKPPAVIPTAQSVGNNLADRRIACISNAGPGLTSCSGDLMGASSGGLIVSTLVESSGYVFLTIIGS